MLKENFKRSKCDKSPFFDIQIMKLVVNSMPSIKLSETYYFVNYKIEINEL